MHTPQAHTHRHKSEDTQVCIFIQMEANTPIRHYSDNSEVLQILCSTAI